MNINRVVLTGNLTKDPELRSTQSGTSVVALRVASNARQKTKDGEWVEKPNYIDITVFGAVAENCQKYLEKGRGIAVDGRLDHQEWETKEGEKRNTLRVIADQIQFLPNQNNKNGTEPEGASNDNIAF